MCFSEWRSDVCSADLRQGIETAVRREHQQLVGRFRMQGEAMAIAFLILDVAELGAVPLDRADPALGRAEDGNRFPLDHGFEQIGGSAWRDRVCTYVLILVVACA